MPSIAIVGTEGSGKTVFITTLAKRLSTENPLGAFMNPQGRKTVQYVEQVWHTLNNFEWPPSTSPGELFDLKWTIHWQDGVTGDIRLVDCAGQDLRLLFADEQAGSENIPAHLKQLEEYCRSANILLLMVNLKDFMGESNDERRTANEWAIKYALDRLSQNGKAGRIAVVFTQVDQYEAVVQQHGDWKAVAKAYLPYVYGAHLRNGHVATMAVSSVSDTQVLVQDGGSPRRVPSRNFRSTGLDEMVTWIGQQLRAVMEEEHQRDAAAQIQAQLEARKAEQARIITVAAERAKTSKKQLLNVLKAVGAFILFLVIGIKGCGWFSTDTTAPPAPTVPKPTMVSREAKHVGTGALESYGIQCWGRVANQGADGNVTIRVRFDQGQKSYSQYQTVRLGAGQYYDFNFVDTSHFFQSDGGITYTVWAE